MTIPDIQDFVKEFAYMESESHAVILRNTLRIFLGKNPSSG